MKGISVRTAVGQISRYQRAPYMQAHITSTEGRTFVACRFVTADLASAEIRCFEIPGHGLTWDRMIWDGGFGMEDLGWRIWDRGFWMEDFGSRIWD